MSWFTPILLTHDDWSVTAQRVADGRGAGYGAPVVATPARGLGSARAGGSWTWADAPARSGAKTAAPVVEHAARAGASLRAPVELLGQMAEAARALGRSESDVWVEAAREWLRRRELTPVTPPAAPAHSAEPRRVARVWDDIDALLVELRAPVASCEHQGAQDA